MKGILWVLDNNEGTSSAFSENFYQQNRIQMGDEFDLSRLSNAGKEAARAHKQLRKVAKKLKALDEEARAAGFSANQVDYALYAFCSTQEECSDASSLFLAMKEIDARTSGEGLK